MALAAVTIADSIAGLSVSGVTIKDLDQIPQEVQARDCPILFPDPSRYVSDLSVGVDSFGSGSAKKTVKYMLNYVFLYSETGVGRGLADNAAGVVTKVMLILDAFLANDALTGSIDITPLTTTAGVVNDPSGKPFYGALLSFAVTEFVN